MTKRGFTIVELLTVMSIIIILTSLLVPAMRVVKLYSLVTKQQSQFHVIKIGLELYKAKEGEYPPSNGRDRSLYFQSGAERLAEALTGPNSLGPYYIDADTCGVVKINQIYDVNRFPDSNSDGNSYVLADVFERTAFDGEKHGMPILYFKAKLGLTNPHYEDGVFIGDMFAKTNYYNRENNGVFFTVDQPYVDGGQRFYDAINDYSYPLPAGRPKKSDSYILLSAGPDGWYFTGDDIYNF